MVGTRRSSRLQAKHEAETATQESEADTPRASPVRTPARRSPGRSPGSTSKSPASATKRSPRGRTTPPRKAPTKKPEVAEDELTESEEERTTPTLESDESAQEIPLDIDGDSPVAEHSEEIEQVQTSSNVAVDEKSDEEDEILMLGEVDEDEDESAGEDGAETETDDETSKRGQDEEEDISQYALLAASGLNLSLSSLTSSATAPAVKTTEPALAAGRKLVPDQLDSGASLHTSYFDFKGHKCNNGAQLRADRRAEEEKGVIRKQLDVVAHSTRQREESKKSSAGRKWFDMESEELTADARRDFALLRMRNYLDPKKFYKTSDHNKHLPKHFQMGVVIEGAHEFKSARLTKKQRQQTFTDEVMADDSIRQYTKRVFGQVQAARSGAGRKKKLKTKRAF